MVSQVILQDLINLWLWDQNFGSKHAPHLSSDQLAGFELSSESLKSLTYHINLRLVLHHSCLESVQHLFLLLLCLIQVLSNESRNTSLSDLVQLWDLLVWAEFLKFESCNVIQILNESSGFLTSWDWHCLTHVDVDHLLNVNLRFLALFPSPILDWVLFHDFTWVVDWMQTSCPRTNVWPIILLFTHNLELVQRLDLDCHESDHLLIRVILCVWEHSSLGFGVFGFWGLGFLGLWVSHFPVRYILLHTKIWLPTMASLRCQWRS